jgi:pyruvate dehydrogenase E2 component (dihydrolipoyllysine-residue acetyltransferase)
MSTEVKLPRLGQGMESGVVVRWLKQEGDHVSRGDPLYELDTEKVTQEVEAEADGVLAKIVVTQGEVEVGATLAVIETDGAVDGAAPAAETLAPAAPQAAAEPEPAGEPEPAAEPAAVAEAPAEAPAAPEPARPTPGEPATPAGTRGAARPTLLKASPLARRIARERGVDLASVRGTGPDGRILAEDVEKAHAGAPSVAPGAPAAPAEAVEVVQLSSVRKTIAKRLTEAWTAPVFQLGVSADMAEALALRERLVDRLEEGDVKPTVNDLLVKLAAVSLSRHAPVNATFSGEEIQRHPTPHVGIAVAAPQGLVVPVIRDAGRLTVQEIARARADLVGRARDNKLTFGDLEGGTFTISNLGMFGVEQFTAVLNPPQVAILAVGAVKDEAVVRDGDLDVAPIVHLVLTCDHRAIDGADGASFLQTLVALIEQPTLAL